MSVAARPDAAAEVPPDGAAPAATGPAPRSDDGRSASLMRLRFRRFRRLKRGWWSFVVLVASYLGSFLLPFAMNDRALVVRYEGRYYFPALKGYLYDTFGYHEWVGLFRDSVHPPSTFGQKAASVVPDYRRLKADFAAAGGGNWVLLPPVPYGVNEQFLESGHPPHGPSADHWLGTDDRGRDILVRLSYGFRISLSFSLLVTVFEFVVGTLIGACLGWYGKWTDLVGQRLVEIWSAIPFLYTVIILSALLQPSFLLLVAILAAFGWMSITYYIRGEFYREKAKDYVAAAIATGEANVPIMIRHILPNALTPIIAFAPFAVVANILTLVALDFLGFGLPAPTASWGELIGQGKANFREWHLVVFPLAAMFVTLQLVVFIGEAVREAFDPKVFSRLR